MPTKFAVKLQYIRTYQAYNTEVYKDGFPLYPFFILKFFGSLIALCPAQVFVDMMDTLKKRSSLFSLVQFRDRWADMRENYQLHKDKGQPLNKELFIASYDQEQIIGTAIFPNQVISNENSVRLNAWFIFFALDFILICAVHLLLHGAWTWWKETTSFG